MFEDADRHVPSAAEHLPEVPEDVGDLCPRPSALSPSGDHLGVSVPIALVLAGMGSVAVATLWLTTRLASIERSIADLRLAVTKAFAAKAGLDRVELRVAAAEQRLTVIAEWRSNLERRAESAECVRAQAGGE